MSDLLPRDWNDEPIEIALIDDLATVLSRTVVGWESVIGIDLSRQPEVVRVMARYRVYKAEREEMTVQTLIEHAETLRRLGEGTGTET
jgi:hypothetical protein